MFRKLLSGILVLIMLCASLTSCSSLGKASTVSKEDDIPKYNAYVELSNYITGWLSLDMESYFNQFGDGAELKFKKGFDEKKFDGAVLTPIIKGTFDEVDQALAYASKKPSYNTADDSMKALCPKMKDLLNTINEVDTYYRGKSFIDDKFAKGKELHKKFYKQYSDFSTAADKFFKDFTVITDAKKKEELDMLKKNDYMVNYYAKNIIMTAQDIEHGFYEAGVGDANILDYDVNKYKEKYNLLTDYVNKYFEYSKDAARCKKENFGLNGSLSGFNDSVKRLKVSATDILQVLQTRDTTVHDDGIVSTGEFIPLEIYSDRVSSLVSSYNVAIK